MGYMKRLHRAARVNWALAKGRYPPRFDALGRGHSGALIGEGMRNARARLAARRKANAAIPDINPMTRQRHRALVRRGQA